MQTNELTARVLAARQDSALSDDFIRQYMPFIRSEAARLMKRPPWEGEDDEFSIAMFAFYEAMMSYEEERGAFLPYAALAIRHRIIDYYRREKRNQGHLSLDAPIGEEGDGTLADTLKSDLDVERVVSEPGAAKAEIEHFAADLKEFGLTLTDIADDCPKQERTLRTCQEALSRARQDPDILQELVVTKKLPLGKISNGSPIIRKRLERHRRYMIALLLAYTNGFEIIRGHLSQMVPQKGDDVCDI